MSVVNTSGELKGIRKTLTPGTLPHTHNSVLIWVEDCAHFAHWIRVSDRSRKVPMRVQTSIEASPIVMLLGCVWQAVGNEIVLLTSGVFELLHLHSLTFLFDFAN